MGEKVHFGDISYNVLNRKISLFVQFQLPYFIINSPKNFSMNVVPFDMKKYQYCSSKSCKISVPQFRSTKFTSQLG